MSARGVLFALDPATQWRLHDAAAAGDAAVWSLVSEELEEETPRRWTFATDKAWDAIHRCLTDGFLGDDNGEPPLNLAILGGVQLVHGDEGVVSVCPARLVPAVAEALEEVTEEEDGGQGWLRARYFAIDPVDYGRPLTEEDFAYTWACFRGLPEFYRRAADAGDRAVVFSVDL